MKDVLFNCSVRSLPILDCLIRFFSLFVHAYVTRASDCGCVKLRGSFMTHEFGLAISIAAACRIFQHGVVEEDARSHIPESCLRLVSEVN